MLRRRQTTIAIATAAFLALPVMETLADRQPMPDAACNAGTIQARGLVDAGARRHIPHLHDFDADGDFACYHFNPTDHYGPGTE